MTSPNGIPARPVTDGTATRSGSDGTPARPTPAGTPVTAAGPPAPGPQGPGPVVDGVRLVLGTFTALPVPPPSRVDRSRAGLAMTLAPAAAVLPGTAAALTAALAVRTGLGSLTAAALAIGVLALTTRGLHLDGLADTADGLASSYDRERALAVMRRGNTGPTGAAALVLVLAVQLAALADALHTVGPVAVLAAAVAGRTTPAVLCARGIPSARPDGLGAAVAGSVPRWAAAATGLLAAALVTALVTGLGQGRPLPGVLAVVIALVAAALVASRAVSRFGGITGDVLGACVEAGTAAALVVLAAAV